MKKSNIVPIGGEPFYSPWKLLTYPKNNIRSYFRDRFPDKHLTYTYGGYYSLRVILQHIKVSEDEKVLIPSYMCPTILYPFKELNIKYEFYKVDRNLIIDVDDLVKRINKNTKAIFFINYFGFNQPDDVKTALLKLKERGIILLQDVVQDFYVPNKEIIGDFAFMSFRKFFPCEGSVIISNEKIDDVVIKGKNKTYFRNKLKGRFWRYFHYKYGCNEDRFLSAFDKAHKAYRFPENIKFTRYDEYLLNRIDFEKDKETRRRNFNILLECFGNMAVFRTLPDNVVPLIFPVLVNDRSNLQRKLRENNLFCPVHWQLSDEVENNEYKVSWWLSEHILSIPINSNTDNNLVIKHLKSII
ncbi:MAG: DegT/DnrJ/EryC1/StrS family aminotransferase [Bacteroidaceae bacterium]|nr:DegT/DnrJ/EryC1/StrS family aminotransferase [Bacteroidaceae bacterium]